MQKYVLLAVAIAATTLGGATPAAAQVAEEGFRPQVFNPFAVRATTRRSFDFRTLFASRTNYFAEATSTDSGDSTTTLAAVTSVSEESSESSSVIAPPAAVGRPSYVPPVRSPFRPPPRPPFAIP